MSFRSGGVTAAVAVAVAATCTSRRHDSRERIDSCEYEYEDEGAKHLSSCDALFVPSNDRMAVEEEETKDKRDKRNAKRNETWTGVGCQMTTTRSGKCDDVVEPSVAEKFSVDFEKWLKTRAEPTSMDLDAVKVVEGVDRYLSEEELSSHGFLGKDPYGLSIDIDLAADKKGGLNLSGYDPILQDELPSEKLLEPCEKVDDEYILPEFQLYHLDPLTLSPDDMMVAGEILPSTSAQSTLNVVESRQEVAENRVGATQRSNDEISVGKSMQIVTNEPCVNLGNIKEKKIEDNIKSQQHEAGVQSSGNPSQLFIEVLTPVKDGPSQNSMAETETDVSQGTIMEQLKMKTTKMKLEPRIIKRRRQMSDRLEKKFDKQHVNNGRNFAFDDKDLQEDPDVMAVVAISTDKTSNTTQIVINTGTERQIYQGKTSELIEATQGNFPILPKIDTPKTIWNGIAGVECNGFDASNTSGSQYEIVISNALEELGITDDNLQPVCVTEHDKVWLCPRDDCNRQFGRLYTLKGHLLAHYGVRPFKCDFEGCTWAFYSEFKLKRHKETHLKRKDYVCEVEGCNRRFTTVYNLWSHAKLHSRPNHIVCQVPDCDEKFQTKRALELHMKSHDQRHAPYVCQHKGCGKRYYSSNALTSHQRSHSYKEIDVKCSWPGCGKVFDKPCRLKAHTRSHTGCKPYHCTYQDCKWAFSSSSKLKRHQKKHTNERKFACDIPGCGKAFMRSEHLKEHRLTHTEGRYFCCFMCDARFSAKSSLYVHIKKHQTKTTSEEPTNIIDDVLECGALPTINVVSNQKRTRTKESYSSRVRPIKSLNQSSTELIRVARTNDAEYFWSEEGSDTISQHNNDIARQTNVRESDRIHQPTIHNSTCSSTDQLRTLYYCPIETCAYLYSSEESLRQHALKAHNIVDAHENNDEDDDSLEKSSSSDAIPDAMDYILYTVPSSSASSSSATAVADEQMIMVMADDAQVVSLNTASSSSTMTDHCLPESEPPPLSFNNIVPSKNAQPSRADEQQTVQEDPATIRNKDQGSARTDLTFTDVLRLKMNSTLTVTDRSVTTLSDTSSNTIALGASDLCESLLLTEELPSMYYQDDAAGAEYQVLLLDSSPLESVGNLRGLE